MFNALQYACILVLLSGRALAIEELPDPGRPRQPGLSQEGQLFSVRIVRGEPIRIFVVGREEAQLDLSQLKLVVRRLKPSPSKNIEVIPGKNAFTISESLSQPADLEIKAQMNEKTETFKFKLD